MTEQEQKAPEEKRREPGQALHNEKAIPATILQEAKTRWGVNIDIEPSRADGSYKGPVFISNEYVTQRVSDQYAVVHKKADISFDTSENLKKRADESRLNDASLQIRYEGKEGKAYFHDPNRAVIDEMAHRMKKVAGDIYADKPKVLATFMKQVDEVKDVMVEKYREAKNKQFEARTQQHQAERGAKAPERVAQAAER